MPTERPLFRVGSALDDLRVFPEEVIDVTGYALHLAQQGDRHPDTKILHGFGDGSVVEICVDHGGATWRTVYTTRYSHAVFVLHAFQKKSKRGIRTPQQDFRKIRSRLKLAQEYDEQKKQTDQEK